MPLNRDIWDLRKLARQKNKDGMYVHVCVCVHVHMCMLQGKETFQEAETNQV